MNNSIITYFCTSFEFCLKFDDIKICMGGCQYILQEVNIKSNMDYLSDVIVCCRELSSEKTTERKVKIQMTLLKLEGYFFSTLHMHILT